MKKRKFESSVNENSSNQNTLIETKANSFNLKKMKVNSDQKFKNAGNKSHGVTEHRAFKNPHQTRIKFVAGSQKSTSFLAEKKSKSKKPKHLARKISMATSDNNSAELKQLEEQENTLKTLKIERIGNWESLCMKLVGPEHWNKQKFDELVSRGLSKKNFLIALGVKSEEKPPSSSPRISKKRAPDSSPRTSKKRTPDSSPRIFKKRT